MLEEGISFFLLSVCSQIHLHSTSNWDEQLPSQIWYYSLGMVNVQCTDTGTGICRLGQSAGASAVKTGCVPGILQREKTAEAE